mmetsp:Transcript_7050/g.23115  ORF Transcript_7050/g.23115 Transcript_7050/m.23115 type:complete len:249 (+) Transcript_7050:1002-1748(+)
MPCGPLQLQRRIDRLRTCSERVLRRNRRRALGDRMPLRDVPVGRGSDRVPPVWRRRARPKLALPHGAVDADGSIGLRLRARFHGHELRPRGVRADAAGDLARPAAPGGVVSGGAPGVEYAEGGAAERRGLDEDSHRGHLSRCGRERRRPPVGGGSQGCDGPRRRRRRRHRGREARVVDAARRLELVRAHERRHHHGDDRRRRGQLPGLRHVLPGDLRRRLAARKRHLRRHGGHVSQQRVRHGHLREGK